MNNINMVKFFTQLYPELSSLYPRCRLQGSSLSGEVVSSNSSRLYTEGSGAKGPSKVEQIEKIKMPGFIHPENMNEEGYFTQKAKQQLEELKKRMEKPKVDNTEKMD